jgi:hypothetical protein
VIQDEAVRKYGLRALLLVVALALAPLVVLPPPGNLLWAIMLAIFAFEVRKRTGPQEKKSPISCPNGLISESVEKPLICRGFSVLHKMLTDIPA